MGQSYDFVMGFLAVSDRYRKQYVDRQREVLSNFVMEPIRASDREWSPYRRESVYRSKRNRIVLKDPETHKAIMTFASGLVKSLYGERDMGYVKTRPRGEEDAVTKSPTVNRLLQYALGLPGHFRTLVEGTLDMLLFGTSIIEVGWRYDERDMPVRTMHSELGVETDDIVRYAVPVYDDAQLSNVDIVDFYPDPSHYRLDEMPGAAKRFRMNAMAARRMAMYDQKAVERAISNGGTGEIGTRADDFKSDLGYPQDRSTHPDFKEMVGYEYWGECPWEDDQYGGTRRVITILNNVQVRDELWPLTDPHLPWKSLIINPMVGRFYGIAPGEVMRFDQDFADAVKILLAEAIIRQVHPPIAYDPNSGVDLAILREWKADAMIPLRGGLGSVGTLQYNANTPAAFGMLQYLQASMQNAGGVMGALSGTPGPDREAASVGVQRINLAMGRPELTAMVLERECLPPIGQAIIRRYQQFLSGTEDLRYRIGELPESAWIGDIMGDFDVEFIGSRVALSKQEKLQSWDRMISMASAVPELRMQIPWDQIGKELVSSLLDLPEIAAQMPDPQTIMRNALMSKIAGAQGGAGANNVPAASNPPGIMPAQAAGGMLG